MRASHAILALLGALGLLLMLWRVDLTVVSMALLQVGWGMALILGQEIGAHVLNGFGWRFAFAREDASRCSLVELVRLRVAGDAINYLTPTATLGGEVVRTAMLRDAWSADTKLASVVIAKLTQTVGQVIFILAGLLLVSTTWTLSSGLPASLGRTAWAGILIVAGTLFWLAVRSGTRSGGVLAMWRQRVGARLMTLVRRHPGRFVLSITMFGLAYAWGALEAYWICRFLTIPVSAFLAVAIEVLSVTADALLFMVPAKIGTQEGGKVAVFAALGLPPSLGFAFGVVRHLRELAWAGLGLLLCGALTGRRAQSLDQALGTTANGAPPSSVG